MAASGAGGPPPPPSASELAYGVYSASPGADHKDAAPANAGADQKTPSVYSLYEQPSADRKDAAPVNAGADQKTPSVYSRYEQPSDGADPSAYARYDQRTAVERGEQAPGSDRKAVAPPVRPVEQKAVGPVEQKAGMPAAQKADTSPLGLMQSRMRGFAAQGQAQEAADVARGARGGEARMPLTPAEKNRPGWAVIPVLATSRTMDNKGAKPWVGVRATDYFFNTHALAIAARVDHMRATGQGPDTYAGADMQAGRANYLLKVGESGKITYASGQGVDTRTARVGPRAEMLLWIKALAEMLREHGEDQAAEEMLRVEPAGPYIQQVAPAMYAKMEAKEKQEGKDRKESFKDESLRRKSEMVAKTGGKYIFAMNAAGQIYAAQDVTFVIHHSSFLAGGAVAAAGEIEIAGGSITKISNNSGHYRTGAAYLWQVAKQLAMQGVVPSSFEVEVLGTTATMRGDRFLAYFDPSVPVGTKGPPQHLSFNAGEAITAINDFLKSKGASEPPATPSPATSSGPAGDVKTPASDR